jgi:hypothetical protein
MCVVDFHHQSNWSKNCHRPMSSTARPSKWTGIIPRAVKIRFISTAQYLITICLVTCALLLVKMLNYKHGMCYFVFQVHVKHPDTLLSSCMQLWQTERSPWLYSPTAFPTVWLPCHITKENTFLLLLLLLLLLVTSIGNHPQEQRCPRKAFQALSWNVRMICLRPLIQKTRLSEHHTEKQIFHIKLGLSLIVPCRKFVSITENSSSSSSTQELWILVELSAKYSVTRLI